MVKQDNQQRIYKSVNEFFERIFELKESDKLKNYFKFLKKVPNHAPFNNTLVFIQNADCGYYATANQWQKRFNRTVKNNARPMVILFPFGPVEFVYDIDQTEGEPITDEKILFWWRENGGALNKEIIDNTYRNLEKLGIDHKLAEARKYFEKVSFETGGYAQRNYKDSKLSVSLHPRYSESSVESYGVLCHEIAHILLGHLGEIELPAKKGSEKRKTIAKNRKHLLKHIMELEAELVAWIVFNSYGIEKNSESYIAGWLTKNNDVGRLQMSDVLKVAGKIQNMGQNKNLKGTVLFYPEEW